MTEGLKAEFLAKFSAIVRNSKEFRDLIRSVAIVGDRTGTVGRKLPAADFGREGEDTAVFVNPVGTLPSADEIRARLSARRKYLERVLGIRDTVSRERFQKVLHSVANYDTGTQMFTAEPSVQPQQSGTPDEMLIDDRKIAPLQKRKIEERKEDDELAEYNDFIKTQIRFNRPQQPLQQLHQWSP